MKKFFCVLITVAMLIPCFLTAMMVSQAKTRRVELEDGYYGFSYSMSRKYPVPGDEFLDGELSYMLSDCLCGLMPSSVEWSVKDKSGWKAFDPEENTFEEGKEYKYVETYESEIVEDPETGTDVAIFFTEKYAQAIKNDFETYYGSWMVCDTDMTYSILDGGEKLAIQILFCNIHELIFQKSVFKIGSGFRLESGDDPFKLMYNKDFKLDGYALSPDDALIDAYFTVYVWRDDRWHVLETSGNECRVGEKYRLDVEVYQDSGMTECRFGEETVASLKKSPYYQSCTYDELYGENIHIIFEFTVKEALPYVRGDVDGNGSVETKDYIKLKRYVLGTYRTDDPNEIERMNVDQKGGVDSKDYIMLKRVVLGTYVFQD